MLWFLGKISILFLFVTKAAVLGVLSFFGLYYRVNSPIQTQTGVWTHRYRLCWHMLDFVLTCVCLHLLVSNLLEWLHDVDSTSEYFYYFFFFFLLVQHQRGEALYKSPDFYKRLAILCTLFSPHECLPGVEMCCTVGRFSWHWNHCISHDFCPEYRTQLCWDFLSVNPIFEPTKCVDVILP